jgi:hypothetical protein
MYAAVVTPRGRPHVAHNRVAIVAQFAASTPPGLFVFGASGDRAVDVQDERARAGRHAREVTESERRRRYRASGMRYSVDRRPPFFGPAPMIWRASAVNASVTVAETGTHALRYFVGDPLHGRDRESADRDGLPQTINVFSVFGSVR